MTSTMVRTYKNSRAFRKDAPRMAQRGYVVTNTFQEARNWRWLRVRLVPKAGKIVVTWQLAGQLEVASSGAARLLPQEARAAAPVIAAEHAGFGARLRRALFVTLGVLIGVPVGLDVLAHLVH